MLPLIIVTWFFWSSLIHQRRYCLAYNSSYTYPALHAFQPPGSIPVVSSKTCLNLFLIQHTLVNSTLSVSLVHHFLKSLCLINQKCFIIYVYLRVWSLLTFTCYIAVQLGDLFMFLCENKDVIDASIYQQILEIKDSLLNSVSTLLFFHTKFNNRKQLEVDMKDLLIVLDKRISELKLFIQTPL